MKCEYLVSDMEENQHVEKDTTPVVFTLDNCSKSLHACAAKANKAKVYVSVTNTNYLPKNKQEKRHKRPFCHVSQRVADKWLSYTCVNGTHVMTKKTHKKLIYQS